jgi:hypothetical protein
VRGATIEAKLGQTRELLSNEQRKALIRWWLAVAESSDRSHRANIPNWDIVSTADIGGKEGLILVEAKAHVAELQRSGSKKLKAGASDDSKANHERIRAAIQPASDGLQAAT